MKSRNGKSIGLKLALWLTTGAIGFFGLTGMGSPGFAPNKDTLAIEPVYLDEVAPQLGEIHLLSATGETLDRWPNVEIISAQPGLVTFETRFGRQMTLAAEYKIIHQQHYLN